MELTRDDGDPLSVILEMNTTDFFLVPQNFGGCVDVFVSCLVKSLGITSWHSTIVWSKGMKSTLFIIDSQDFHSGETFWLLGL